MSSFYSSVFWLLLDNIPSNLVTCFELLLLGEFQVKLLFDPPSSRCLCHPSLSTGGSSAPENPVKLLLLFFLNCFYFSCLFISDVLYHLFIQQAALNFSFLSNQLIFKSAVFQISCFSNQLSFNQLSFKSAVFQISCLSNQLSFKSAVF